MSYCLGEIMHCGIRAWLEFHPEPRACGGLEMLTSPLDSPLQEQIKIEPEGFRCTVVIKIWSLGSHGGLFPAIDVAKNLCHMEMPTAAPHVDTKERSSGKIQLGFVVLSVTMRGIMLSLDVQWIQACAGSFSTPDNFRCTSLLVYGVTGTQGSILVREKMWIFQTVQGLC